MKEDFISKVRHDVLSEQKHTDGISHIVVGMYLSLIALLMVIDRMTFAGIFIIFIPTMMSILKKRYTYPRIGFAKVADKQEPRQWMMVLIAVLLLGGAGVMFYQQRYGFTPAQQTNFHLILMATVALFLIIL